MPSTRTFNEDSGLWECSCGQYSGSMYDTEAHVGVLYCGNCGDYFCCNEIRNHGCRPVEYVNSYSYKPDPEFRGDGWHIGIELEVSASDSNVAPIYEWAESQPLGNGLFYCKEDSSVAGFEIVTHPMTGDYFRSFDWEGFFEMLNSTYPTSRRRSGETESNQHGLHIHVERSAFSRRIELARWAYLINKCPREVWTRIARRNPDSWGAQSTNPVTGLLYMRYPEYVRNRSKWTRGPQPPKPRPPRRTRGHRHNVRMENSEVGLYDCICGQAYCPELDRYVATADSAIRQYQRAMRVWVQGGIPSHWRDLPRYSAINQWNEATCEVRSFRSTRDAETFRQSVGTVLATVDYSTDMQPWRENAVNALQWDSFVEWVAKNETHKSVYPTVAGIAAHGNNGSN